MVIDPTRLPLARALFCSTFISFKCALAGYCIYQKDPGKAGDERYYGILSGSENGLVALRFITL